MGRSVVATDNFNRASLGTDWTQLDTFDGSLIINTSIRLDSDNSSLGSSSPVGRWDGAGTFSDNQYAKITVKALDNIAAGHWGGVIVRASADQDAARDFYYAIIESVGAGPTYTTRVGKVVNGTHTSLASTTQTWSIDDTIELEVEGSDLRVYRNGSQITALNVTDTALTTGKPGAITNATFYLDDWEGGDVTAAGGGPATGFSDTLLRKIQSHRPRPFSPGNAR